MPLKKSKPQSIQRRAWKVALGCSEADLASLASKLSRELRAGDRVFLEGPLGVGKTTFARFLLQAIGVSQPPEGSPTFPIVHEYDSRLGGVAHIDFYRLRSEQEIEEAGIPVYFWERKLTVISEWVSNWPEFERRLQRPPARVQNWFVFLSLSPNTPGKRDIRIELGTD